MSGIPLLALLLVSTTFVLARDAEERAAALVARTLEARTELQQVLTLLVDAETGIRGYLLTEDPAFLGPQERALAAIPAAFDHLGALLSETPDQANRLDDLRRAADDRLGGLNAARAALSAGRPRLELLAILDAGNTMMNAIRATVGEMAAEEDARLAARRASHATLQAQTAFVVAGATALGLVGGGFAAVLLGSGIVARLGKLEGDAARLISGELPATLSPANDEIGRLADALADAGRLVAEQRRDLREARSSLEHLIATGPLLMVRLALPDGRTTYVSPNAARILGEPPVSATVAADWWASRVAPADLDQIAAAVQRSTVNREPEWSGEWQMVGPDGRRTTLEGVAHFEYDDAGQVSEMIVYGLDISERRRGEVEREAIERELWSARETARRAAEAANLAKSDFLARMSHELRTPLNAVLGFSQLLEMEDLNGDQRENVGYINRAGRHLLTLIDEVLDISRIETGRMTISPEPVQVGEIVAEVGKLVSPLASGRRITIDAQDATASDAHVLADRQRLRQVLLNLLSNAVKYNRDGGSVSVACRPAEDAFLRIAVSDTGYGVPPQFVDRLFQPFDRLGAHGSSTEGTGLGLALSKGLVEAMDGRIGFDTTVDAGTTFWIELPTAEGPIERFERLDGPTRTAPAGSADRTILHIEDNEPNRRLVERVVRRHGDARVVGAPDGQIGLRSARELRPDLILLDLHLPDGDGREILRDLRRYPETRAIPVVVLSADATTNQIQRLLGEGAAGYLTKPLEIDEFLGLLDRVLDKTRSN